MTAGRELDEIVVRQEQEQQQRARQVDRPDDAGSHLGELLGFGPEPEWVRCACGTLAVVSPCFECRLEAERRADRARARALGSASIPASFTWATVRAPELAQRVDALERPLPDLIRRILGAGRVVLAGGSGAGKTSLAIACLRERPEAGRFVSAIDLARARTEHALGDGDASLVDLATAAPLLLIDDLGEEVDTRTSAVKDVIRRRFDMMRPTWVTTGFRPAELAAKYGDGIKRRLFEPRGAERVCAEWLGPLPAGVHRSHGAARS